MKLIRKNVHSLFRPNEVRKVNNSRLKSKMSIEELKEIQLQRLLRLLRHAKNKSNYYSRVLLNTRIEKLEDLEKAPILTKQLINTNFKDIMCNSDSDYFLKNSTSGSTGVATIFGSDKRYVLDKNVDAVRGDELSGKFNYLDRSIVFWGAKRDLLKKNSLKNLYNLYIKGLKTISTYHMSDKDIEDNIRIINRFKPKAIVGYPSALNFMANYLSSNGNNLDYSPKAIISAGEMLYSTQKENIEKNFKSKVYNRYGSREFSHIASECQFRNGLHYDVERLVIEIVDDKGKPCPDGKTGNILITDLYNFSFPMIRYNIGDIGAIQKYSKCKCGVNLPKLDKIEGRVFDIIQGVNGNNVSGTFWTIMFRYEIKGIEGFQIRQKTKEKLLLKLKINDRFDEIEKEKIFHHIRTKLGKEMQIEISTVEKFEYTPSGKFKWIVSDLQV